MKRIDSKSLVIQITLIIFILNISLFLIFTFYFLNQNKRFNEYQIEKSMEKISSEKAQVVSLTMNQISNELKNLSLWAEKYLFNNEEDMPLPSYYKRDPRGIFGRVVDNSVKDYDSISNVYYPKDKPVTQEIIHQVLATEKLDQVFKSVIKRNEYIQWVYITTNKGLMRIQPYSTNDVLEPDQIQTDAPFYVYATESYNPSRNIVWTKPYYDYMGTGWMITCSYPIYHNDQLAAVICLDIRWDTLKNDILTDFRMGKSGFAFLINQSGDIIYHPEYIPEESQHGDILNLNILSNNLSKQYNQIIINMVSGKENVSRYYNDRDAKNHLIAYSQVPDLGWILGIEANENDFILDNTKYASNFFIVVFSIVFLLLLFGVFLFKQYSKPILQITSQAQQISEGKFGPTRILSNFSEIKLLSEAFNYMSNRIEIYTQDLIKRNKQIETIFNTIGGLLMIVTPDYQLISINKNGYRRFANKNPQIIGQPCYKIIAGQNAPCKECKIKQVVKTKKYMQCEIPQGDQIYLNNYYPIFNSEKTIDEIIVYSQNITERIMIEKELVQTEKMASIGQLSSAIAHELKNPLAVMKGTLYILDAYSKDKGNPVIERNLEILDESITGAEKVIYNLLDFSSSSRKNYELVDISKLIDQILLFERKNIIKQTIQINVQFNPNPIFIWGNIDSLKHIFLNVITNALQALSSGGKLTIKGYSIEKDKTQITISDTGYGIPYSLQDKIFDPFFSTKEAKEGTGLGLWLTKKAVSKLSGKISVRSAPGKGTTFTITLPSKKLDKEMN